MWYYGYQHLCASWSLQIIKDATLDIFVALSLHCDLYSVYYNVNQEYGAISVSHTCVLCTMVYSTSGYHATVARDYT